MTQPSSTNNQPPFKRMGNSGQRKPDISSRRMRVQDPQAVLEQLFRLQCELAKARGEPQPPYPFLEDPTILQWDIAQAENALRQLPPKIEKPKPVEPVVQSVDSLQNKDGIISNAYKPKPGTSPEPYTNTGLPQEIVHDRTGIEMVYIPAGNFMMGSPASEAGHCDDETQHRVTISKGFYMGKYEVTQAQWQGIMDSNPSFFNHAGKDAPVENVSWNDCQAFIAKVGDGLRLPTEAEWEYACRAGMTTRFNIGDFQSDLSAAGWFDKNSGSTTHPVGQKKPNKWGLYDMHGNVWEWCQDWYAEYAGNTPDPMGVAADSDWVLRGGCWYGGTADNRSSLRRFVALDARYNFYGFRLVLPAGL